METWFDAISSLGFPIVCAVAVAALCIYLIKTNRDASDKREKSLQNEIQESRKANKEIIASFQKSIAGFETSLNNFNNTISKIDIKLDSELSAINHNLDGVNDRLNGLQQKLDHVEEDVIKHSVKYDTNLASKQNK